MSTGSVASHASDAKTYQRMNNYSEPDLCGKKAKEPSPSICISFTV
jgi:hypothetical protein